MKIPGSFALAVLLVHLGHASAFAADVLSAPLIPRGSAWRYLDNGSNQGTNWFGLNFNDSSWSNGVARLGYGAMAR